MTDKATEYRHRLHLLIHNEPHPDTRASFESQIRWRPRPVSRTFQRLLRGITSDLTPVQRLLVKLPLRQMITPEEGMFLRSLHEEGRYRCDPNPEVYLFCVGRTGGKTLIGQRLAFLMNFLQDTSYWVPNKMFEERVDWAFAHGIGDFPETHVLCSSNIIGRPEPCRVMDEMLLSPVWHDQVADERVAQSVCFFSLVDSSVLPDIDRSCMALSLESQTVYPEAYLPSPTPHPVEYQPPPVNDWFHHPWGQGGG